MFKLRTRGITWFDIKIDNVVIVIIRYREHLNASDYKGLSAQCYYHWFEPALEKWLDLAKLKIVQRVKKALDLGTICQGDSIVKHTTSSNDVATALCHVSKKIAITKRWWQINNPISPQWKHDIIYVI